MKELSEFIWVLYRDTQMNPYLIFGKYIFIEEYVRRRKINYIRINGRIFAGFPESKLIDKSLVVGGKYK